MNRQRKTGLDSSKKKRPANASECRIGTDRSHDDQQMIAVDSIRVNVCHIDSCGGPGCRTLWKPRKRTA